MTKGAGRPTFEMFPDRLCALREKSGFTHQQLADKVYALLRRTGSNARTRESGYQRIERTGKTLPEFAKHLAEVLANELGKEPGSILAFLQGAAPDAPPDRQAEIEAQLRKQLAAGGNKLLQRALECQDDTENRVSELARQIATQLEVAHLEQRKGELASLAELTGWTVAELLRPASALGYWLLITQTAGHRETEILLGVNAVLNIIRKEGADWLDNRNESDARVVLTEEDPWMRVCLEHPRVPEFAKTFSFVRCAPNDSGLQWVKPTWWDRFWIERLQGWACGHANFVTGFKPAAVWPRDLRALRLVFASHTVPKEPADADIEERKWLQTVTVHKGNLDEIPQRVWDSWERDGSRHNLVIHQLCTGLWKTLEPHLSEMPADWWTIRPVSGRINFELQMDLRGALQCGLELREGVRYVIYLAEELPSGELRRAPWRFKSVSTVSSLLQDSLQLCLDQIAIGPPAQTCASPADPSLQ